MSPLSAFLVVDVSEIYHIAYRVQYYGTSVNVYLSDITVGIHEKLHMHDIMCIHAHVREPVLYEMYLYAV